MLYHVDVFMPQHLRKPCYEGEIAYWEHAVVESKIDRYGKIALPRAFKASAPGVQLIETETDDKGRVIKQLWRQPLDSERDLVMAITNQGMVKTVWVNLRSDQHSTLNVSRYVRGKR